jgi:4-diphosphocytidyl-2-C-methyl-D-erythritol kinase
MRPFISLHALAPAKINLGLFVGPSREDGRHEIVSVMQSISLADTVTLEAAPDRRPKAPDLRPKAPDQRPPGRDEAPDRRPEARDELLCAGVDGPPEQNLALRALAAFRAATGWDAPPMRLTVEKMVPVAAGLGGGSADAGAVLRLAAAASGLGDHGLLHELAVKLGADVPAQVRPGRWLAQGAGERLTELPESAAPLGVLVLSAEEPLTTAAVYAELDRLGGGRTAAELGRCAAGLRAALADGGPLPPRELLTNDLQRAALSLCPAIASLLDRAGAAGAHHATVSGSGPTVLGLYAGDDGPARADSAAEALRAEGVVAFAAIAVGAADGEPAPVR